MGWAASDGSGDQRHSSVPVTRAVPGGQSIDCSGVVAFKFSFGFAEAPPELDPVAVLPVSLPAEPGVPDCVELVVDSPDAALPDLPPDELSCAKEGATAAVKRAAARTVDFMKLPIIWVSQVISSLACLALAGPRLYRRHVSQTGILLFRSVFCVIHSSSG
jgi:hypothetical protein